mgnify:CR=1 FL=1
MRSVVPLNRESRIVDSALSSRRQRNKYVVVSVVAAAINDHEPS